MRYRVIESRPVELDDGIRSDQVIELTGVLSRKGYPERLRRIRYYDVENHKMLIFLTNNMLLSALVISNLYKCRWQIELFFKWIHYCPVMEKGKRITAQ